MTPHHRELGAARIRLALMSAAVLGFFATNAMANGKTGYQIGSVGLPRFGGRLAIWESGTDDANAFSPSSHIEAFFGSARGGAILPSRPALWCGCRAQRRSRIAAGDRPLAARSVLDGCEHGGKLRWARVDGCLVIAPFVIDRR